MSKELAPNPEFAVHFPAFLRGHERSALRHKEELSYDEAHTLPGIRKAIDPRGPHKRPKEGDPSFVRCWAESELEHHYD